VTVTVFEIPRLQAYQREK